MSLHWLVSAVPEEWRNQLHHEAWMLNCRSGRSWWKNQERAHLQLGIHRNDFAEGH